MAPRKPLGKSAPRGKAAKAKVTKKVAKPSAKSGGNKKAKALVKSATKVLTQAKKPAKATKRGRPAKSPAKSTKTDGRSARSPSKSPVKSAKSPVRSAKSPGRSAKSPSQSARSPGRPAKTPSRSAKSPGRPSKSPGRPAKSPGRPAKSPVRSAKPKGRPAKSPTSPAKSPGRVVKSPGRAAKSPGRVAKSPGRAAKSPGRAAKSPGRAAKSPGRPTKSPGRAAKSPGRPTKSPGRAAKSTGQPVKSPGRSAVKPSRKSPQGRVSVKSSSSGKSPTKANKRPSGRSAKPAGRPTTKSRGRPPPEAAKRLLPQSAPAKSPLKKPAKVVATLVLKKSPRGRPARQTPTKVQASSQKSPIKMSPRRAPVTSSPASQTHAVGRVSRGSPKKLNLSPKKAPVNVKPKSVSPMKKSPQALVTKARSEHPATLSPRKRATLVSPPPAKKAKAGSVSKGLKGVAAQPKLALSSPPRPTRIISRPARLRDAAPEKPVAHRKLPATKTSPALKSPPKPTRVVPTAETRPSRSDMASRRDAAVKGKENATPSKRSGSSPRTSPRGTPEKKTVLKGPVARTPILKPARSGSRSTERSRSQQGGNKPTPKRVTIVVPPKDNQREGSEKGKVGSPSSPPVSHPCRHCGLTFRSRSDAELHEHRCSKNESRSDKRYPCNKCNGMFTMTDLILHKKQAHPQRDASLSPVKQNEGPQEPSQSDKTPVGPFEPIAVPSGGFVFKLPNTTGDLSYVIRKAVEAAANAGLVPANKKIVITTQKPTGALDPTEKRKPAESPTVPAKKRKVMIADGQGAARSAVSSPGQSTVSSPGQSSASSSRQSYVSSPRQSAVSSPGQSGVSSPGQSSASPALAGKSVSEAQRRRFRDPNETVFTCLDCGDVFPSRREVSDHKAKCPGVGKTSVHACMDCNMTFMTRIMLNAHKREVHVATKSKSKEPAVTVRSFKCSECELFFPVDSEVKKHIWEIHGGVGQSTMCNVVATPEDLRSKSWTQNISNQEVEDVITNIVNGVTKGKDTLSDSFDEAIGSPPPASPPASPRSYSVSRSPARPSGTVRPLVIAPIVEPGPKRAPGQCLDCFMKVTSRLELAQHKRYCQKAIENRQLFCFDCSSSFKSYFDLSRHKHEMHMGEAHSLKCLPCGAVYSTHAEWRDHCKTHQLEAPSTSEAAEAGKGTKTKAVQKSKPSAAQKSSQKAVAKETTKAKGDLKDSREEQQAKATRSGSAAKKSPVKGKGAKEAEKPQEVQKTRSGRIVHKKRQDDDIIVEKVIGGRSKVATVDVPAAKTLGTIRFIQSDEVDVPIEKEKMQSTSSPRKRSLQGVKDNTEKVKTSSPKKRSLPASEEKEQSAKSRKRSVQTTSSEATPTTSSEPEHMEIAHDEGTNISLANGLISISAEKANDYQIFVDAKQDGSCIQVKLIRNDEVHKEDGTPAPTKSVAAAPKLADKPKAKVSKSTAKEAPKIVPTPAQPVKKSLPPKAKSIQTTTSRGKDAVMQPTNTASSAPAKSFTGNAPTDMGKVVQKGKPFVIGGQTLVPIQFPPGYQLPGGATGGQKVFAIPSTNLPPGLLQLLAKQNKGLAPQQAKQKPTPSTSMQTGASKQAPGKTTATKKTPAIPTQQSVQKSPKQSAAAVSQEAPASLKGMTGAQLMARAQARILGRPLPPLKIDGPIPPFKTPAKKASPTKNVQPAKSTLPAKGTQPAKNAQPAKSQSPAKNSAEAKAASSPTAKRATAAKTASPAKSPGPAKNLAAGEGPSGNAAAEKSKASYQDPLFVYQCTSCQKNFKSTTEINKHMNNCPEQVAVKPRCQRSQRQKGTDVWHMKPVTNTKGPGKTAEIDGVEWFVASKNT